MPQVAAGRPVVRRVALVSGAAGGIGSAICGELMDAGMAVVATDVRPMPKTRATRYCVGDLLSDATVRDAIAECDALGGVCALVNCAGIMRRADVFDVSPALWDEVFDVNVGGAFRWSKAVARSMIARDCAGAIVNIGSVNAEKVFANSVIYCTSKGALHAMTRALALSLAPHRIRVNVIGPGAIADTEREPERWALAGERDLMRGKTPLGTLGASADVAPAVRFLCSDDASFITGATLFIDGGRTASVCASFPEESRG